MFHCVVVDVFWFIVCSFSVLFSLLVSLFTHELMIMFTCFPFSFHVKPVYIYSVCFVQFSVSYCFCFSVVNAFILLCTSVYGLKTI